MSPKAPCGCDGFAEARDSLRWEAQAVQGRELMRQYWCRQRVFAIGNPFGLGASSWSAQSAPGSTAGAEQVRALQITRSRWVSSRGWGARSAQATPAGPSRT